MNFINIIEWYRNLSLQKKAILLFFVAALYPSYKMLLDGSELESQLEQVKMEKNAAEIKFKKAREQKEELPNLEEKLEFTESELAKASKKLPNQFQINQVLEKAAMIAQEVGVVLQVFDPTKSTLSNTVFRQLELPIDIQLTGTFERIVTFFDRIVHLDLLVHIRNMDLTTTTKSQMGLANGSMDDNKAKAEDIKLTSSEKSLAKRKDLRVKASGEMVIFRSLTEEESRKAEALDKAQAAKPKT